MERPIKKRKIAQPGKLHNAPENFQQVNNARDIQDLIADYSGSGVRQFRDFLNQCSESSDVKEEDATRNRGFLEIYLEAQYKNDQTDEEESVAFTDITKIWSYAFQNNSSHLLTFLPAALAILVRLCSYHEELRSYGTTLIRSLLQQANLKIMYKCLSGNKSHHISPCLRLLTEMNRFNFGTLCGQVHSSFDFTIKDLVRAFEVRSSAKHEAEDPTRPTVRSQAVRFFLSFLQNAEPSIRNDMLGLKMWISGIFKNLRFDSPTVISELIECMSMKVMNEKEIPRATKTTVFNEWVLGHILSLYSRVEMVKISRRGKEEEKRLAELAHEFLLSVCTTPGNGVCFSDQGWFPPGYTEADEKRTVAPKVYNRALLSFANSIRPYADPMQLALLLDIFKKCPEILANHFLSNTPFGFDPKFTSTWIGYCTFLSNIIALPVPRNFGSSKDTVIPPPANIIIENILPKPLTKAIMSKCITHSNKLIKFLSTRLLITSFQKLGAVLEAINSASECIHDPTGTWSKCRRTILEEFCKRVPDIQLLGTKSESGGVLQSEGHTRLLSEYYLKVPEIASSGKFDVNLALSNILNKDANGDQKGIRLLEISHLLKIATEIPDAKWWNKIPSMSHSPFVSILKLLCSSSSSAPLPEVYALLRSFASNSYLFQTTTIISPLEALIDSLSTVTNEQSLEAILLVLDEVVARCVRAPFKYLDDFTELAHHLSKDTLKGEEILPVSPFLMALAEQWKFFGKKISAEQKTNGAMWFIRFVDSCALLGENRGVIGVLCGRISANANETDANETETRQIFEQAEKFFQNKISARLVSKKTANLVAGRNFSLGEEIVDPEVILNTLKDVQNGRTKLSLFHLASFQRLAGSIAKGAVDLSLTSPRVAIARLNDLMKYGLLQLNQEDHSTKTLLKSFLVQEIRRFPELLAKLPANSLVWLDVFHGFVELICATFDGNDLASFDEAKKALSRAVSKTTTYLGSQNGNINETDLRRFVSDLHSLLTLNLDPADLTDIMCSCTQVFITGHVSSVLGCLMSRFVENGDYIPLNFIDRIFKCSDVSIQVSSVLLKYLSSIVPEKLKGLEMRPEIHKLVQIECILVKRVDHIGNAVTDDLGGYLGQDSDNAENIIFRFAALLDFHSIYSAEKHTFSWAPTTSSINRDKLRERFIRLQKKLLETNLNEALLNFFLQAAHLFPGIDKKAMLNRITRDRKKSNLWASVIFLIDKLIDITEEIPSTRMKAWFLFAFDHLTRRFAEDAVLSRKVRDFAKELAFFIERRKISLDKVVPRMALNAILEAAIGKHIKVTEVVCLAVTVISLSPAKILDLTKFLQIILGHPENPLAQRGAFIYAPPEEIHGYITYLTARIFWATKHTASNLATMDATLELYRGTNDSIDRSLLEMISFIESHLAKSCAGRMSSWSMVESADLQPLISRTRGRLNVVIDSKKLHKSVYQLTPIERGLTAKEPNSLDDFLSDYNKNKALGACYDPKFLLPALTYCIISEDVRIDFQTAIDKHGVGYAMVCLCSMDLGVRKMAVGYLGAVVSKVESSTSRNKTQINHLLYTILASLEAASEDEATKDVLLPTVIGIFFAQALQVLTAPAHFLYEKLMELLLRNPLLNLYDIPYMLTLLQVGNEHHKEVSWIINILAAGIKTAEDLVLYHKRNVFGSCMSLYGSPFTAERVKGKVIELLWNTAGIIGGSTILITRNGVLSWIEQLVAGVGVGVSVSKEQRIALKRLAARLWESSPKEQVCEWSKGDIKHCLVRMHTLKSVTDSEDDV